MANYKRKKSRASIRCNLCTDARGYGNSLKVNGQRSRVQVNKKLAIIKQKETQDA